jgi:hypothetical protein
MKLFKNFSQLQFFLLFITLYSCSKDKLSRATETGANTFSCKIDGKVFKPTESVGIFSSEHLWIRNSAVTGFTLYANSNGTELIPREVGINLFHIKSKGTYDLGNNPYAFYMLSYSGGPQYYTNRSHTGKVKITRCDTINKIYSGTFFFKAIDDSTGVVVNVTDGRFDVKGQ